MTAGGSICIAALTLSGSVNSWTPEYCVESIINVVIANMCAAFLVYTIQQLVPEFIRAPPVGPFAQALVLAPTRALTLALFLAVADSGLHERLCGS